MDADEYLFLSHPREQLGRWCRALRRFRFCRAAGGLANDGDQLVAAIDGADAARAALKLPSRARSGQASVGGVSVAFVQEGDALLLLLAGAEGNPYEVTEADVANALAVERKLEPLGLRFVEPPRPSNRCVTPASRPDLFADP